MQTLDDLGEPLGYVVDGSTPRIARFVSPSPPPLGDYVVVEAGDGSLVLGMVRSVGSRSVTLSTLSGLYDPVVVERLSSEAGSSDVFFECSAALLTRVEDAAAAAGTESLPRVPPLPGARVYSAPRELLEKVFGPRGRSWIRIGVLAARREVPVYVDVNMIATRHAAVLAVTGAGKSNTVAVMVDRIVRELGGTVLVFDFHGEYVSSSIGGGPNVIEAKLNPRLLSVQELMLLLGVEYRFYNQERILRTALSRLAERQEHGSFLEDLRGEVEALRKLSRGEDQRAATAVLNKVDALLERYGDILDDTVADPVARIEPGKANVLDLSRVDEDAADVIVSHVLRVLLWERKVHRLRGTSRVPFPVLTVLEEAHILAPRDEDTLSKYWLSRVAREGRKFGLGLVLVSQRPKGLDPNILSQANNLAVLRIVEPSDQRYIQEASESLSSDLVEHLPGLGIGEAVLVGPFVRLPALVKVDRFDGRLGGGDIDVVAEWTRHREELETAFQPEELYSDFQ